MVETRRSASSSKRSLPPSSPPPSLFQKMQSCCGCCYIRGVIIDKRCTATGASGRKDKSGKGIRITT
ncbi:hypothetical protein OIU76_005397 [Salix suchowensis]|nr:hypothetical protein OIU76_005397 [Salix suchowensis]